jgi:uncharacterized protein YbjT (DUF2867 family)
MHRRWQKRISPERFGARFKESIAMNNILVLGGSGFLGQVLCEKLVERTGGTDGRIVVPTRHLNRTGDILALPTAETELWDVHDDAQLQRMVRRRDVVINLIGILHGTDAEFQRVHVELPSRLARACAQAGVRRVVHVSAIGASDRAPSKYLRTKAAGELALHHPALDTTVLRPSVMFGERDRFMNRFARLQRALPVMALPCANARFQPVWVEDVATAIVRAIDTPATARETLECVGPTVYTLKELVHLAGKWSGHDHPVIALPDGLGRLQATLFEWLPGQPLMSRDNLASMRVASVASGTLPGLERLGITPRSLDSVMPPLLGDRAGPLRLAPLRALARRR